jgi:hypothetical protein
MEVVKEKIKIKKKTLKKESKKEEPTLLLTKEKTKEICKKGTRKNIKTGICTIEKIEPILDLPDLPENEDIDIQNEQREWLESTTTESKEYDFLYPTLNDSQFNIKIAERKEFNDTKYDGEVHDVEVQSDILCNAEFELAPHQSFVRNFLSFQTPYNSLLLYHGLGSGKTCSAISVAEEMRDYMKHLGIVHKIIVVASPNVQDNFRLQLFDEKKLKLVDGLWTIRSCTGNKLLQQV